jgi:hypothetical protein
MTSTHLTSAQSRTLAREVIAATMLGMQWEAPHPNPVALEAVMDDGRELRVCAGPSKHQYARVQLRMKEPETQQYQYLQLGASDTRELLVQISRCAPKRAQRELAKGSRFRCVRREHKPLKFQGEYAIEMAQAQDFSDRICAQLNLPPVLIEIAAGRAGAYLGGTHQVVQVGKDWFDRPTAELEALIAHEIGHHRFNVLGEQWKQAQLNAALREHRGRTAGQMTEAMEAENRERVKLGSQRTRRSALNHLTRVACALAALSIMYLTSFLPPIVGLALPFLFCESIFGLPDRTSWEHEYACDQLASELIGAGDAVRMLTRLPRPAWWSLRLEVLLTGYGGTHPPTASRIARLKAKGGKVVGEPSITLQA